MEELQACPRRRGKWIRYSALDAKATHDLALGLQRQLAAMPCLPQLHLGMDPAIAHATGKPFQPPPRFSFELKSSFWKAALFTRRHVSACA